MRADRRSSIDFIDGLSGEPRTEALAEATILSSSEGLAWAGLHVERGYNGPWFVKDLGVRQHYLALNIDEEPLRFEVERPGGAEQVVMLPGAVWFCPAFDSFTHRVPRSCSFALVTVDPTRVERLAGDRRVRLNRSYAVVRPQLVHLVRALVAEAESGGPGGAAFADALGTAIALQMIDAFGGGAVRPAPRGRLSPTRLRRVLELIDASLEQGVSVEAMAAEAGLSPAHFARAFKEATGRSPHRQLLVTRLERARAAMQTCDAKLMEIARRFGFSDQAHFTRMFRRHFGVTPGAIASKRAGADRRRL